jgi:hypothetical protein
MKRVGTRPEILSVQPAYQKYEATVHFLNLGTQSKNFKVWLDDTEFAQAKKLVSFNTPNQIDITE